MSSSYDQPTESLLVAPLNQIQGIVKEFERSWTADSHRQFASMLDRVSDQHRVSLLRSLLQIDVRIRGGSKQSLTEQDYLQFLPPEYETVVQQELLVSTRLITNPAVDTEGLAREEDGDVRVLSQGIRLGDYVIETELGRGGMGVVFAARHATHGSRVALKTLPAAKGLSLSHFKREFRALADINHPNLIGLHHLQEDAGQWFFTMDLVDGVDFRTYSRPKGQLDSDRLRRALTGLVNGVVALHKRQIIHRDLKPSNVMVASDGRILLLDFGLVVDLKRSEQSAEESLVAGTPAYMAPEQFQLENATPALDWYAVGIMLYECITGKLPFRGSVQEIFHHKQRPDVPPITSTTCPDLAELTSQLLAFEPAERPSDDHMLRRFGDVASSSVQAEPATNLTGREHQIEQLNAALAQYETDRSPVVAMVSGRSAEGKTALVERLLAPLRADRAYEVLEGRCYDRESVPFKAMDALIDSLCNVLLRSPDHQVKDLLDSDVAVLAELFPVLQRVGPIAALPQIRLDAFEVSQVRRIAAKALGRMLGRISKSVKLVCFIDDLQWGDAASAEMWLDILEADAPNLILLGTFRSDEAVDSEFLVHWNSHCEQLSHVARHQIEVGPLDHEQSVSLVVDIVGLESDAVRAAAAIMARESGGNPLLLTELASIYDPASHSSGILGMEDIIRRKLDSLPDDAHALLDVISISGHSIKIDEAAAAAGQDAVQLSTIHRMRSERLLRLVDRDGPLVLDTYHDRVRQSVLDGLPDGRKKSVHLRLAETIEASHEADSSKQASGEAAGKRNVHPRVYDLAHHFFQAGDPRAFGYQVDAGETAIGTYAYHDAIRYLERALSLEPNNSDREQRYQLRERLAHCYAKTRQLQRGIDCYQLADEYAEGATEKGTVWKALGELRYRSSDHDEAILSFDRALRELGHARTTSGLRQLLELGWLGTVCNFMWLVRPHRNEAKRRNSMIATDAAHGVAITYLSSGNVIAYTHACLKTVAASLRSGDPAQLANGYSAVSFNYAVSSLWWLSKVMMRRAERFARQAGDRDSSPSVAAVEGHTATVWYMQGRARDSVAGVNKAIDALERFGDPFFYGALHHSNRHSYMVMGDSQRELETAQTEWELADMLSDWEGKSWADYGFATALARMGRVDEALNRAEQSMKAVEGRHRYLTESISLHHYAFAALQASNYDQAAELSERSIRIAWKRMLFLEYNAYSFPRLIEGLLGPHWTTPIDRDRQRKASKYSKWSRLAGSRFPNIRPISERVEGRRHAARGRTAKARKWFERAIKTSKRYDCQYEGARALIDLAAITPEKADDLVSDASRILRELKATIPAAESWQLGDNPASDLVAQNPSA